MSDKALFYRSGFVNKQNCLFWGTTNPKKMHQGPIHSVKCFAWGRIMASKVTGFYFF